MIYCNIKSGLQFRSYSDEQILHKSNHHRSDSAHSIDLFKLVVPTTNGSSLSPLICSICSLPMMKPTLLPCQHTFCFQCIQNSQQARATSLPIHGNNSPLSNDKQPKLIKCQTCFRIHSINSLSDLEQNQSIELLINSLLCETCHRLYPSNQVDTCLHCFDVLCPNCYDNHLENHENDSKNINTNFHRFRSADETKIHISKQSSDKQVLKSNSFNIETRTTMEPIKPLTAIENNEIENIDPSQINHPKKKSNSFLQKIINPSRHRQSNNISEKDSVTKLPSSSVKQTNSLKLPRRPKLNLHKQIEEISKLETLPPTVPVTPVRRFINLYDQYTHTAQHIKQCKQRQSELDRSVQKLIEVLTTKTNDNLNLISHYWIYLKQLILDQYETKTNRFQFVDYLLKTCCSTRDSRKQIESYFQQNDDINAELQVLSTTVIITNHQQNSGIINQLFDQEEQTTIRTLRRHLDSLLSSYTDELSFVIERINVYESRFASWKNSNTTDLDLITYEWTQIIEHDYPALIEKISNDFITKIPQIEKVLVQMLRNMKKRLLNSNHQIPTRRISDC